MVSPVPLSPTRPNAPTPQGDCMLRGRRTKEAPLTLIAGEMPKMHGRVGEWARRGIEFLALPNGVNRPMSLRCDCRTPNGCKGTPGSVQCVWAWTNGSRQLGVGGRQTVALRPRTPTPPLPLFPILPLSHAHTPKPPDVPRPKPDTNAHSPGESPNPPQVRSIRFAVSYPTIGRTQPVHITIR